MTRNDTEMVNQLIEAVMSKGNAQGVNTLNQAQRIVFLVADLDTETATNGLFGYYGNSSGDNASEVVGALRQIGALQSAELIATANAEFPNGGPPRDRLQRASLLWALPESAKRQIEEAGDAFSDYPDDLGEKYEAFILANADELAQ